MKKFTVRGVVFGDGIPNIAVPVTGRNEKEILSGVGDAKKCGDLIELRIDAFKGVHDACLTRNLLSEVRSSCDVPVLFTLRTAREGGEICCNDEMYETILTGAIESGFIDLIDIEAAFGPVAERLLSKARRHNVRTVLSQHDFERTPATEEICAAFARMEKMGADVAKGAYMPCRGEDVDKVLAASNSIRRNLQIPFILISMGEKGQLTRIYAESVGSCVTFAAADGKASAPGQIDAGKMRDLLLRRHAMSEGKRNIYLIGFMGAGKSTVSSVLGRKTGIRVLEMDREIETDRRMSIPEIFEKYGEPCFRDLETDLLRKLDAESPAIVSCGGGAVLRERNVLLMKSIGTVILLDVSPEEVMKRLEGQVDHRPNLRGRFSPEGIRELQDLRREAYQSAADAVVDTNGKSADEIADRILDICESDS